MADRHTWLTDVGLDALRGGGGQAAAFLVTNTARVRSGRHRCTKRMLAAPFHSGGEWEQFLFGDPTVRRDRDEIGLSHRQRAGLVDDRRINCLKRLERFGIADKDAMLGTLAGSRHEQLGRASCRERGCQYV